MIETLQKNLQVQYPNARILGFKSPPFVTTRDIAGNENIRADIEQINALKPDLVWIGISSPKQDYLMHHFHRHLDKSLMLGVGGVFLYFADGSLKSPEFIKKIGLRWAYRLSKEPARLWPKYYGTFRFLLSNSGYFIRSFFKKRPV
jgi:N-acetylglucosaminyldiphosphoundecaprenol N-acetyl-beta-D-mannosaminyltransferase